MPDLRSLSDGIYGDELDRRIGAAADAIRTRLTPHGDLAVPRFVAVLGSGLGGVVELLDPDPRIVIPYGEIPGVPVVEVAGHAGQLVAGRVAGTPAIVLSGRAHAYEGYSHREATLLLRAVLDLGADTVLLTNAAGGLNPAFDAGDVMLITDHINLSGENPLLGPNIDRLGPRFPPMTDAYDPALRDAALEAAGRTGVELRQGVYVMLSGPAYETRAEMRMLRQLGADAVGMSTAHEAIVARHAGRRLLAFSLITNTATGEEEEGANHEEVIEMGRVGAARLVTVLGDLLPRLA
ncbi:MAG: purine-nucleoside phosphorylase [Chloroflexi bacterium]|nr:purine-nucleoside phosphorylase [Chloroflexota bacterium]